MLRLLLISICLSSFYTQITFAQTRGNLDESKAGQYTLPSLLTKNDGFKVKNAADWEQRQRPDILKLFAENVYGRIPGKPTKMHFKIVDEDKAALKGRATRKQVIIYFGEGEAVPFTTVLLYLPNKSDKKFPVFLGLNFDGNHTISDDTSVIITDHWMRLNSKTDIIVRGKQKKRWPVEELINKGYGVVTAWYEDFEADYEQGWQSGMRTSLSQSLSIKPSEWGAIAVWGWGLSRIMDYLQTDPGVDADKVVITGHSRLGKAALWSAANDPRFAIVVSNNSGEGGAALARRNYGETVKLINDVFPHWFIDKYKTYNDDVSRLPVDQHMLLALMAPRPLYVASATEDQWADPKGEFLSAVYATEVYHLYNKKGIEVKQMPRADQPLGENVRYHIRTGAHDMLLYDWMEYVKFADRYFKK
jgi:hypothetical protein